MLEDDGTGSLIDIQYTDYYAFGLVWLASDLGKNKYLFNGKELQDADVSAYDRPAIYDFVTRQYNAVTARWSCIDKMAEKYSGISPYVYCFNNPARFTDPTGMDPEDEDYDDDDDPTGIDESSQNDFNSMEGETKERKRELEREAGLAEFKATIKETFAAARGKDVDASKTITGLYHKAAELFGMADREISFCK